MSEIRRIIDYCSTRIEQEELLRKRAHAKLMTREVDVRNGRISTYRDVREYARLVLRHAGGESDEAPQGRTLVEVFGEWARRHPEAAREELEALRSAFREDPP